MRFSIVALLTAAVTVSATQSCSSSQFFWSKKDCCLPHGGTTTPAKPPKGVSCPTNGWYYHQNKGCCVPNHPSPPTPSCPPSCSWHDDHQVCHDNTPTTTTSSAPTPTAGWGNSGGHNGGGKHYRKRSERSPLLCAKEEVACRVGGESAKDNAYECINPTADVNACGGCPASGKGQDCTKIANSWNVGCAVGVCQVFSCEPGFKVSLDGRSCTRN